MRKRRFIYIIFSFISIIVLTALLISYEQPFLFMMLIILIIIPNNIIRNKERQITGNIIIKYGNNCDPYEYIGELSKYASKCFLTKKQKILYDLYYALAYIDAGDFGEVEYMLLEIDKNIDKLDEVTKVLYLKAWCDYFFYTSLDEKMKSTLLKLRDIITNTKNYALKGNYSMIYMFLEAKYYIISNTNIPKAKELLKNRKSMIPSQLSLVTYTYLTALIDIKENKYLDAKAKLQAIASKNDLLHVVRHSEYLLEQVNERLEEKN